MAKQKSTPVCGVYKITCTANGKIYIGSSIDVRGRWNDHLETLRNGHHHNPHLQAACNLYGVIFFTFQIIEECLPSIVREREQYWLDTLRAYDNAIGYNLSRDSRVLIQTPEMRARVSTALRGRPVSAESREHLRQINTGKHASAETRAKQSASQKGRKKSIEHRAKIAASHIGISIPHTPESKAKISAALRGMPKPESMREKLRNIPQEVRVMRGFTGAGHYLVTDPEFFTYDVIGLKGFCSKRNLSYVMLRHVARGRYSHWHGWTCARLEN